MQPARITPAAALSNPDRRGQRAARRVLEAKRLRARFPEGELVRVHVLDHRQVAGRRPQVLPDREQVAAVRAQVRERLLDLVVRLAQAEHDPRLGLDARAALLPALQDLERAGVAGTRAHRRVQALDRFHVVVEDFRARVHDNAQGFEAAFEIWDEHFDRAAGLELANAPDDHGKNRCAAVPAFIAVDAGDHGVFERHGFDRLGDAFGFHPVDWAGLTVFDVAKPTAAGANVA